MRRWVMVAAGLVTLLGLGCRGDGADAGLAALTPAAIEGRVRFLASDLLEGRAPGTRGAALAASYIATQFQLAGLRPPVGDSSYFQPVPLLARTSKVRLRFRAPGGAELEPGGGDDLVVWSADTASRSEMAAELVFVGYGITAPEYDWDDYKDVDVGGKILLMLVNDPGQKVAGKFRGDTLTYYGRWTYKLEEAARRGAAGALLIHTPETAGHGWNVTRSSGQGARLHLDREGSGSPLAVAGWLTRDLAEQVATMGSLDFTALLDLAALETFRPIATGVIVQVKASNSVRRFVDFNVAGVLPGSDSLLSRQVVVYSAHYDHLGIGRAVGADSIYNGAYDNASGTALLLTLAEAFARLPRPPARSVLFLATTAEEAGLLGSQYYVEHPLFPLERTVAAINLDGANLWGPTEDVVAITLPGSGIKPLAARAARAEGLRLEGDRVPGQGYLYRSDQLSFLRAGLPAVYIGQGLDFIGRLPGWGAQTLERFLAERYRQPGDEVGDEIDYAGAVQQGRFAFRIGLSLASDRSRAILRLPEGAWRLP